MKKAFLLLLSTIIIVLAYAMHIGGIVVKFNDIYPDIDRKQGVLVDLIKDAKPLIDHYGIVLSITVGNQTTWDYMSKEMIDYVGEDYIQEVKETPFPANQVVGLTSTKRFLKYSVCNIFLRDLDSIDNKLSFYHELGHCMLANDELSRKFNNQIKDDLSELNVNANDDVLSEVSRRRNELNAIFFSTIEWYNHGYFKSPIEGLAWQCNIFSKYKDITSDSTFTEYKHILYPYLGDLYNCDVLFSYINNSIRLNDEINKYRAIDPILATEEFMDDMDIQSKLFNEIKVKYQ